MTTTPAIFIGAAILILLLVGPGVVRIYLFDAVAKVTDRRVPGAADGEAIALAVEWAAEEGANGRTVSTYDALALAQEALAIRALPEREPGPVSR